jgi:uncharacterized protein (DUF2141 family)
MKGISMKKHLMIGLLALAASCAASATELVIEASGFDDARGQAVARIYAPGDRVTSEPRWSAAAPIVDGHAQLRVQLKPGQYAATIFHDRNSNGRLDHNALGLPGEPLGFSGGFALSLTSGMPTFDKLRIDLPPEGVTLRIDVK